LPNAFNPANPKILLPVLLPELPIVLVPVPVLFVGELSDG